MAEQVTREEQPGYLDNDQQLEAALLDPTFPALVAAPKPAPQRSYYDTRWPLVNQALAITDGITRGRAGLLQRLSTYLVIGGTAAVVNLGILAVFFHFGSASVLSYWLLANVVAYEISIMANFIPNDYFTFRHLAGHDRSWLARCVRFHITSLSGVIVTFILSAALFHLLKLPPLVAQAIALIIATAYNFTVHHLFTYAHKKA